MPDDNKTYDVFIAHSANDAALALEVVTACRANGLEAITDMELQPGANVGDAVWEALAESRALVAILSPSGLTPSMGIELGAALAWNKPIFGVLTNPSLNPLPGDLMGVHLYTPGRIEDVIRAIKQSGQELSEEDRVLLARLFTEVGVSVDQLALERDRLGELVKQFAANTGRAVPGERLLSELLRMRKQGRLTRGRSPDRMKPRRGTA